MGKVVKAVTKSVKSFVKAPFDAVKAVGKGNLKGLLDAGTRIASAGTVSLSDKGIINPASVAKALGMSSSAPAVGGLVQAAKKVQKSQLSQLRQGKGSAAGGSYTSIAKDPLGGQSGKTGK